MTSSWLISLLEIPAWHCSITKWKHESFQAIPRTLLSSELVIANEKRRELYTCTVPFELRVEEIHKALVPSRLEYIHYISKYDLRCYCYDDFSNDWQSIKMSIHFMGNMNVTKIHLLQEPNVIVLLSCVTNQLINVPVFHFTQQSYVCFCFFCGTLLNSEIIHQATILLIALLQ